jgi:predicted RND superfamily exporter protein
MALIEMPLTLVTQILPTFLMVVGMGDAVHILAVFYMKYEETGDKEESIVYALGHSGLAVFMTSLTTSAGLASFTAANVKPIVELGTIAPVGVMIALLYTILLLPALISLFPVRRRGLGLGSTGGRMDRALEWIARVSCARPWRIIFISAVIFALSLACALQIRFSHNALKWFAKDHQVRVDTEYLDARMAGSVSLEAVVDTGEEGGLYDPGFLRKLESLALYVEGLKEGGARIGKSIGIDSIVKEINRALNEDRQEAYVIPDDRELVAQELLLFETSGSDDLEDFTDSAFQRARFTMTAPFDDAVLYTRILGKVRAHMRELFPGADIATTGIMPLFVEMISNTIKTMTKSYAIALVIITFMMIALIGRVRIGMLSMIPNLLPILMILGIMGIARIPMDFSNVLVGSVAIGLVVDDTIHFFHNFRRYFDETGDVDRAVSMTLQTTGRAIAITSIILVAGFYIWMLAEMKNTFYYALLTGSAVIFALVADFFLTPALLKVVHGRRGARGAVSN